MSNIRLTIEFDGAGFSGWQSQPDRPTVQDAVAVAIRRVYPGKTTVYGCSRTDAGVSARGYVANFHTDSGLEPGKWQLALNFHLPAAIRVHRAEFVPASFHARFSALSKDYRYRIVRGYSPLRHARVWELRHPVDAGRLRRALREFTGRRDFQPFCLTRDKNGFCNVMKLELDQSGDELEMLVRGDRFLYKMVRRIVGAAVHYGCGRLTLTDLRNALKGRKHRPFRTAPAAGLLLDSVKY